MHETSPYFENLDNFVQNYNFLFPESHKKTPSEILSGANPYIAICEFQMEPTHVRALKFK